MQLQHKNIAFLFLFVWLSFFVCYGQTDVATSIYGAFGAATGPTGNNNTVQSPSNSAGGLFELQRIFYPILGFEVTYSYNRADQSYNEAFSATPASVCSPVPGCPVPLSSPVAVSANEHEFTADWIPSKTTGTLRPFAVLGGGVLLFVPSGGQSNTTTATKPVFVFGLGMDWARWKRIGLRFQYRGNLYTSPHMLTSYYSNLTPNDSPMLTNEPMIGVYFRLP